VELITQQDWSPFFTQWLTRPVNPSLQIEWGKFPEGKFVSLSIKQAQASEPFQFPLTLDLAYADGQKKRVKIEVTRKEQTFILPVENAVEGLIIDPETELLIDKWTDVKKD